MVIWLRSDRTSLSPDASTVGAHGDVISRDAFGALMEIDEAYAQLAADREAMLVEAQFEAERILDAAREQAEAIVEEARREYETAAERGYRDGEQRALSEWMERLALSHADERRLQSKMRERLAQIVTLAVEQIVNVQESRSLFEKALSAVDRIVEGATYLRVSVSPGDYEVANSAFERLAARWRELGRPFPLSVIADKRLAPGSCLCESDFGAVDASLATQLRAMRSAVSRALKQSVNEMQRDGSWDRAAAAGGEFSVFGSERADSNGDDASTDLDEECEDDTRNEERVASWGHEAAPDELDFDRFQRRDERGIESEFDGDALERRYAGHPERER
jgi:type III secretion protein L